MSLTSFYFYLGADGTVQVNAIIDSTSCFPEQPFSFVHDNERMRVPLIRLALTLIHYQVFLSRYPEFGAILDRYLFSLRSLALNWALS